MGSPAFEPQRVLAGRYRLEQRLGGGGMGAIWRAEHLVLQAPVAVKLIDPDAVQDEQTVARFLREAKAAATLRSPHVVQILDYGMDDDVPFIVMELLEGETLAQRLKRFGPLSASDTARIVTHVGRAIGRAHEAGIVHRDLKPENVFIVHNEDEDIAKVLDFGVAKVEHGALAMEGERTRTGSILGTPYYMSPEQAQGNKAVDHRSDLWSLAVIAFECLTGKRPFYSDGLGDLVLQICVRKLPVPSEVAPVPIGFDAWFERALSRDPDDRFQSAREMTDALREALGIEIKEPVSVTPEILVSSRGDRTDPPPESRPSRAVSGDNPALASSSVSQRSVPSGAAFARAEGADATAPTLMYAPARVESELELSGSRSLPEASSGSGLGVVVAVAAVALGLGLGGGIYALQRFGERPLLPSAASRTEQVSRPTPTANAPTREDSVPAERRPSDRSASERSAGERTATDREPGDRARAGTPPVAPSAVASASATAPKGAAASTKERRDEAAPVDAGAPLHNSSPDGGWVKPAWAIPDPDPPRAHDLDEPLSPPTEK